MVIENEYIAILILSGLALWGWWRVLRRRWRHLWQRTKVHLRRQWHPKSPEDCPYCRAGITLVRTPVNRDVLPWHQLKDPRGRKKQIDTQGFACPNPACGYHGLTNDHIHALVGYGKVDAAKQIQRLRCQACKTTFTSRWGTPLYYLKTTDQTVEMVLWFLAEGVDESVLVRFTGHSEATIARWLERMGSHSAGWHNVLFRGLSMALIQMDELYAKVRGIKEARWLWLAIDPVSKVIPSLHLGGRKSGDAYALVHDLETRLEADCVPAFTTDGLRGYFYGITAHFGHWWRPKRARKDHWRVDDGLLYGQLVKRRKSRQVKYTIMRMMWGKRRGLTRLQRLHGFTRNIQTAIVERVNLTFRQSIAPLTRKTWSLAQSEQHLLAHVEWFRSYYHLVRPHESLREPISGLTHRYRKRTPAMAAGLSDHMWDVGEILRIPLIPEAA